MIDYAGLQSAESASSRLRFSHLRAFASMVRQRAQISAAVALGAGERERLVRDRAERWRHLERVGGLAGPGSDPCARGGSRSPARCPTLRSLPSPGRGAALHLTAPRPGLSPRQSVSCPTKSRLRHLLGTPAFARHRHTGGLDDGPVDTAGAQPTRQPEASPGLRSFETSRFHCWERGAGRSR